MTKIKLSITNRWTGSIIFEYEKENNTIAQTVREAIKGGANLSGADLSGANLSGADLRSADLRSADLSGADLRSANLSGADLSGADLSGADLRSANLSGANLRSANLSGANLSGANLSGANLSGADLRSADLSGALNADYAIALTRVCADGDIIGWKKCENGVIVKLLIPKEAKRNNAFGRKCRAEYADVLEIIGADIARSSHYHSFTYKVGDRVRPSEPFNEDFTNECSTGIHFFITRIEAENY